MFRPTECSQQDQGHKEDLRTHSWTHLQTPSGALGSACHKGGTSLRAQVKTDLATRLLLGLAAQEPLVAAFLLQLILPTYLKAGTP